MPSRLGTLQPDLGSVPIAEQHHRTVPSSEPTSRPRRGVRRDVVSVLARPQWPDEIVSTIQCEASRWVPLHGIFAAPICSGHSRHVVVDTDPAPENPPHTTPRTPAPCSSHCAGPSIAPRLLRTRTNPRRALSSSCCALPHMCMCRGRGEGDPAMQPCLKYAMPGTR